MAEPTWKIVCRLIVQVNNKGGNSTNRFRLKGLLFGSPPC